MGSHGETSRPSSWVPHVAAVRPVPPVATSAVREHKVSLHRIQVAAKVLSERRGQRDGTRGVGLRRPHLGHRVHAPADLERLAHEIQIGTVQCKRLADAQAGVGQDAEEQSVVLPLHRCRHLLYLGRREHRALLRRSTRQRTSSTGAWVGREHAIAHRTIQQPLQHAMSFDDLGCRNSRGSHGCNPLFDVAGLDPTHRHGPEAGEYAEPPGVAIVRDRGGTESALNGLLVAGPPIAQRLACGPIVDVVAAVELGALTREPAIRGDFRCERLGSCRQLAGVGVRPACLPAPTGELAKRPPRPPRPLRVWHGCPSRTTGDRC